VVTPSMKPPGWYADPTRRHECRYWGGADWTANVADGGVTATDSIESPPPSPSPQHQTDSLATAPAVAGRGRRGRRRWALLVFVIAAAIGLAAGLVAWAPWASPPLLRPAGLAAGPLTTSSVALHWSGPATGPAPDSYVILRNGSAIGSVHGTVTSYRDTGLTPVTEYTYRVAAVRGNRRSVPSAILVVTTLTPPMSAARWQGPSSVSIQIVRGGSGLTGVPNGYWSESWLITPKCAAGPCAVVLSGSIDGHKFSAPLARAGAVYTGATRANLFPCGSRSVSFPLRYKLTFRVTITSAYVQGRAWTAGSWTGTVVMASPYTSSGNYYCTAHSVTASLSG
jgi:Fibronectin type III domain/Protein of unknown function (DUF2510)